MRYKAMFAAGLVVGYVLGTRAGRERYEQIKRAAQRVADSPAVQEAAGLAGAKAAKVADKAKAFASDKLGGKVPFTRRRESRPTGKAGETDDTERVSVATGWPGTEHERVT